MPIDPQLLTLTQWLSPAFPTGAFAYSHGLETAVRTGRVKDATGLSDWLAGLMSHGTGRNDAVWIALAYDAPTPGALVQYDDQARAFAGSAERQREGSRQGQAFAQTVTQVWGHDVPNVMLPLAVGAAARAQGLDLISTIAVYLQNFLSALVSAAQRLLPLGQTQAQKVLAMHAQTCLDLADTTPGQSFDDLHNTAFLSDICAMQHETLQPRLFQS